MFPSQCRSPWTLACIGFALAACLHVTDAAATSVWKWRDANGRITVSDQPPPRDIPERDILERPSARPPATVTPVTGTRSATTGPRADGPSPTGAAASAPAPRVDPDLEARRRAESAQGRGAAGSSGQEDPQALARKRENCQRARTALASLESGQRMARVNEKGERIVLDDATRAQETRRAREVMAADCV